MKGVELQSFLSSLDKDFSSVDSPLEKWKGKLIATFFKWKGNTLYLISTVIKHTHISSSFHWVWASYSLDIISSHQYTHGQSHTHCG